MGAKNTAMLGCEFSHATFLLEFRIARQELAKIQYMDDKFSFTAHREPRKDGKALRACTYPREVLLGPVLGGSGALDVLRDGMINLLSYGPKTRADG